MSATEEMVRCVAHHLKIQLGYFRAIQIIIFYKWMSPKRPCQTRHFCKQYCDIAVHHFRTINLLRIRNLQATHIVKFHTVLAFWKHSTFVKLRYLKHLFQKSWTILYLPKMLSIVQRSIFLEQNCLPGRLEYEISVILRKVLDWRWFLQCLILILVKFSVLILHSEKKL